MFPEAPHETLGQKARAIRRSICQEVNVLGQVHDDVASIFHHILHQVVGTVLVTSNLQSTRGTPMWFLIKTFV